MLILLGLVSTLVRCRAHSLIAARTLTPYTGARKFVPSRGADEATDDTATAFTELVRDQDAVLDVAGGDHPARGLSVLKPGGILVTATFPLERVGAARGAQDSRAGAPEPSSVRRYRRARQ
jgi:NADPH:quinone reductase-like Zn-dependent oxidoreductase